MRASVKAAKSSAENRGRCLPASPGTSGGSAKMVEDRLGKTRSAVVTAIRICFIISRCPPELPLGGTKIYDGPLHGSPLSMDLGNVKPLPWGWRSLTRRSRRESTLSKTEHHDV